MGIVNVLGQEDVDRTALGGKRIAVIGFGSQGHAHALNLADSGVDVVVGLRPGSASGSAVAAAKLEQLPIAKAVATADITSMLIPDPSQPKVYREQVAPNLRDRSALLFAHGFNVHYRQIEPPSAVDVIMVAPKGPGAMVRSEYLNARGVPALVAVHQDSSGHALAIALAYADALGCMRAGVLKTTFAEETETDLFGEQAVLCGGLTSLIKAGFETLVDAGYAPELAYFECLHEMKLIVDLVQARGLSGMRTEISDTAEFGDYLAGPRLIGDGVRTAMREVLADIRCGAFAQRWIRDGERGNPELNRFRQIEREHPLESVGRELRSRMAWL